MRRPHPRVTASPLSLEERPLGRVSKDETGHPISWFEKAHRTAQALPGERLLTMRSEHFFTLD
jgi:hypothetical protein